MFKKHGCLPYLLVILAFVCGFGINQIINTVLNIKGSYVSNQDEIYEFGEGVIIDCPGYSYFSERPDNIIAFVCDGKDLFEEQMFPETYGDLTSFVANPEKDKYSFSVVKVYVNNDNWILMELWAKDLQLKDYCVYEKMGQCPSHILLWVRYIPQLYNTEYASVN